MKLFKLKELKFKNEKNKILHSIRNRDGGVVLGVGVYLIKNLFLTLIIFTLLGCGEIERILLSKEKKEWRKFHLSNETEIFQKCMRLNNKYTPQNKGKITKYEGVEYKNPFFYVRFYGSDSRSYSTCHVNIGYTYPEYSFSENYFLNNNLDVYVGEHFLCDYMEIANYPPCPREIINPYPQNKSVTVE